jgi:hypothetical protein
MKHPIAIWYHCLTQINQQRLPAAQAIIHSQMKELETSGLLAAASNFFIGFNGETGTLPVTLIPEKAMVLYHTLKCRNELRTLRALEKWLPGHEDWLVLYFHSKGATHKVGDTHSDAWRECSMHHLVKNWRECVRLIDDYKFDSVGCHWMCGEETPPGQSIWAGNAFWATGRFLNTLPSVMDRDRIKQFGLDNVDSRYESEVWIGNGPQLPSVFDYCPGWNPSRPHVKIGATVNV